MLKLIKYLSYRRIDTCPFLKRICDVFRRAVPWSTVDSLSDTPQSLKTEGSCPILGCENTQLDLSIMSFGFAIGDFIATGELCWRLYREVYEVAKGAPAEVQALHRELSDMSNVIKALVEDVKQPGSAIAEAGADRVSLANSVMDRTKEILQGLEELLKNYDILKVPRNGTQKRMFVKRMWSSMKYSSSVGKINELRSKVQFTVIEAKVIMLTEHSLCIKMVSSRFCF